MKKRQLCILSFILFLIATAASAQVTFTDVTEAAGFGGLTVRATWGDYDNDGDVDVALFGEAMGRKLYRNEGNGIFIDVTEAVGITDASVGSSRILGEFGYSPISYFRAILG